MTDASVFGQGRGGEVLVEDQIRLPTLVDIFELLSREVDREDQLEAPEHQRRRERSSTRR